MKRFFPLLLVLLMLTGCSGTANRNNIINLLSSPKLSERESRIITAINGYLGGDVILKYPKQGDISPVQVVDLNNDMVDEAVVLYNEPSAGSYVRMAVLTQDENGWQVSYDTEGFGTEVYRIEFDNLTNNDEKEIVVSYTFADSQDKILSVYFMKDGKSDSEHTQTCQHYVLHDMTGDGAADIVLAGVNADNQRTQIKVLSTHYTGSYLTTLATKQVNIRNATVNNIAFTRSDFTPDESFIIDYQDTGRRVYTEALHFDGTKIDVIMEPDVVQKIWYFDYRLNSRDINGDGYYETPTIIDDGSAYSSNLKQMEWTSFMFEIPQRVYYGVCEADSGIFFPLPDVWQNNIELAKGEKSDSWQVMHINTGEALVTFEPITAADSESRGNDEVIVGKGTVLVKITFAPQVSHDQREYIVKGLMDIR